MSTKRARITDRNPLTATDNVLAGYEQVNKSTSPDTKQVNQPVSQEANNTESQEVYQSASQLVNKPTSLEVSKSASQEVNNIESQEVYQSASQLVNKPIIRKATFQLDAAVIEDLDRYHLQLQIALGKRNAPYKEIIVEEAIAQWLERATKSPDRVVKSLLKRQEQRSV
jgi:hypothetical protein